jgi:hypothetical protein
MAHMNDDLEAYRKGNGLSYRQMAARFGVSSESGMRRYCLGDLWPSAERIRDFSMCSGGKVTVRGLWRRRLTRVAELARKQGRAEALEEVA